MTLPIAAAASRGIRSVPRRDGLPRIGTRPLADRQALTLLLALAGASALPAQDDEFGPKPPLPAFAAPPFPARVPIHTAPDGADQRAYGYWCAGRGYKASFHDGFVFYPALGPSAPANLPLRWRTEAVTVGDRSLFDPSVMPEHARATWRYEYRWPQVTEAYDVREEGVEQSFVVHAPGRDGDLVIVGRLDTPLRPAVALSSAHAELTFADAQGAPRVSYGAAFAIDAAGRRTPIATSCDGERIRLTVPRSWLEAAVFPVTVDPLTAPIALNQAPISALTIDRENESAARNVMIVYAVENAFNDHDCFALLYSNTFNDGVLVFADFAATTDTYAQDAAFAGGADRWVVASRTATGGAPLRGQLYFHAKGDTGLNTGLLRPLPALTTDERHSSLSLGGAEAGTQVFLAFVRTNSRTSEAWGTVVTADRASISSSVRISTSGQFLQSLDDVDVSHGNSAGDPGWLVAYTALVGQFPNFTQELFVARVEPATFASVAPVRLGGGVMARVEGRDGRFLVTSLFGLVPFAWQLVVRRVDWPRNATAPTVVAARAIANDAAVRGLAYDHVSRSHWGMVLAQDGSPPMLHAVRVGYTGAVTESVPLAPIESPVPSPTEAVTFHPAAREFQLAYVTNIGGTTFARAQRLQYPADAVNVRYGAGCNDVGLTISAAAPLAGSEFFQINLRGGSPLFPALPNGTPCVLMLSLEPDATPIRSCTQLVSLAPRAHIGNFGATMLFGHATVRYPLTDDPLFQRDLYGQWVWRPGAAAMGMSSGLRMQVR